MTKVEKKLLFITSISHSLAHFFELLYPAIAMFVMRDLDLSMTDIINAGFPLYLCYGVLAIPWGLLSDRYGQGIILAYSMLITGIGSICVMLCDSMLLLSLSLSLIGVGISAIHPATMGIITNHIKSRGQALGIFGIGGNLGMLSAPFIGGVGAYFIGWRWLMLVAGIASLLLSLFYFVSKIEKTKIGSSSFKEISFSHSAIWLGTVLLLVVTVILAGLIYRSNIVLLPIYLEGQATGVIEYIKSCSFADWLPTSKHQDNKNSLIATLLLSFVILIGVPGQYLGGYFADRWDLRVGYLIFFALALPCLFLMSIATNWYLVILSAAYFILSLGMQPFENSIVATLAPPNKQATAFGIKFTIAFGVGSFGVWMVTFFQKVNGYSEVYSALSILQIGVVSSIVLMLYFSRKNRGLNRAFQLCGVHNTNSPATHVSLE